MSVIFKSVWYARNFEYSCKRWSCSTENNRQSDLKKIQETLLTINKKIKFGETWWHKTLSASAISKQVSRCYINFRQELTCQILTNQITKIGCRAWPTRYHGESKVTAFSTSKNWLDFQVRGQFEIKILLGQLINTTYFLCI